MHSLHVAAGARLGGPDGWELPATYAGAEAEVRAAREGAGLWDLSAVAKWEVRGAGTAQTLERFLGGPATPVGRAAPGAATGTLALRLADDQALVLGPPGMAPPALEQAVAGVPCAHLVDRTSGLAGLRLGGPAARSILATLTALDLHAPAFPDLACAQAAVARVHAILLRRDLAGLPSLEVYVSRNYGAYLWEAVLDAGRTRGLAPCGFEAEQLLAGLPPLPPEGRGRG